MRYFFIILVCSTLAYAPVMALAQQGGGQNGGQGGGQNQPQGGGQNPGGTGCTGGGTGLCNPLDPSISSIPAFFLAILDILLVFAIPFVVFFIIYAGFLFVTARGNTSQIEQAKKALLYAIIGGLLIFGARAILDIIKNTVSSVTPLSTEEFINVS